MITSKRIPFLSLQVLGVIGVLLASTAVNAQVIVGHRGASYDAPENTLSAFRLAWEQGADGIEGDFYITKDQQVVCIHDADTKRTAGKQLKIADSTLAQLRELEYGKWKDAKFSGEPIPTFEEVLALVPKEKLFVIELKVGPEIVPLLKPSLDAAIAKNGEKTYLFISFNEKTVAKCKELYPKVRAHWLTGFKQDKKTGVWSPDARSVAQTVKTLQCEGVGLKGDPAIVNDKFIEEMKQGGVGEFHVWTIDEPADAKLYQRLGAVGITTNRPAFIRQALHK